MDRRPDPDQLLRHIQSDENRAGKLKIFLGYAAGVGKTYAMLEAAHQRKEQSIDVVVGYVETHNRAETQELLAGLDMLPRRNVEYHGVTLPEMDVDAILARQPALVLIDELAHTNIPGSRHPKRYMDVEEILDAGIDVYTTLNIQHLESLNDIVAQVTGVVVHETVPDRVIDAASEIEVIDLPPDELLIRLTEGKVYIPDQAVRAIQKFFRKGNLTALREMSLRRAAERVDNQMRAYMETRAIPGPWGAADRLLVCLSPGPLAERLVRTTRRLADELNAEWFAVHVNLTTKPDLNPVDRERIGAALQLVENLGGKPVSLVGESVHETVLEFSRKNNITKIIVGKPLRPRWREWLAGSVVDHLIHSSGDIDIYVISSGPMKPTKSILKGWLPHHPFNRYLLSLLLVAAATTLGLTIRGELEPANLVMLYLLSVLVSAIYLGRGPSLLATVTSVLAFDFFLVPPYQTFAINDTQYLITFIGLFIVSFVVSSLAARVREQAEASILREMRTLALYELGSELTAATDLKDVSNRIVVHIGQYFMGEAVIFLPEAGQLIPLATSPDYISTDTDLAVASWAYKHDQIAGLGTDTLPATPIHCQPLKTARGLVGVLGIRPANPGQLLTPDQRQMLGAFANQAALAVERSRFAEQARQAELLRATEKLQTALLNSISHDLRTPLVTITGALSALDENEDSLDNPTRRSLIENARSEADRLNRLVGNLLNITRIEAGALRFSLEPCEIADLLSSALETVEKRLQNRLIQIHCPPDLPLVKLDFVLMVQVLVNLLDNAVKYSPPDQPIEVNAALNGEQILLKVEDHGSGIPPEDLERVFDKFYRVRSPDNVSGTGLGLSICKGIVEAHHGTIKAENRTGGGTTMVILLPVS